MGGRQNRTVCCTVRRSVPRCVPLYAKNLHKEKQDDLWAEGNLVDVCDTIRAADKSKWNYIRIAGKYYGFVAKKYLKKQ